MRSLVGISPVEKQGFSTVSTYVLFAGCGRNGICKTPPAVGIFNAGTVFRNTLRIVQRDHIYYGLPVSINQEDRLG